MPNDTATTRIPAARISDLIKRCLMAVDLPEADAQITAGLMADADLNGADGHGVFRLPGYIKRIRDGAVNPRPSIRIDREKAAMALIDGDNGMGHLVMKYAADVAVEKARECGVGWAGAHHSNHAGPAYLYAKMPMAADMIGLYVAVGSANHLPPWGGTEMLLSTNPIAVAVPALDCPPIILDMATTVAAYGKVKTARQRGQQMPVGWMIDKLGQPLTDPNRSDEGFLLPIGGPKGYGLSLIFGLLAGTLNGAAFGKDVVDFNADSTSVTNTGHFVVALDIKAFTDVEGFKANVDAVVRTMKASPTLPGFDEVRLPGEQSFAKRQDYTDNGIPLHDTLLDVLAKTAADLGVDPLV
ncbi:MAG: Ldh family oxidoreductase [Rhodospirillales bacterium]|nr:Ldh family oxidoreductase [Rhodospirillales bacterium]